MISSKKIENVMALLLLIGTLASVILVMLGGLLFLMQHGEEPINTVLITYKPLHRPIFFISRNSFAFLPLLLINLGLFLLVFIQIFRVGLLTWFYFYIRDLWFTFISFFVLLVLLYGLFGHT